MHTSRNALDWAGTYAGLLPCTGCPGLHLQLTLAQDGSFEMVSRRLDREAAPTTAQGQFEWVPEGNIIALDTEGDAQRFAVGEGRLLLLEPGQAQPAWNRSEHVLQKSAATGDDSRQGLGEMLVDHRWLLVNATDASNQRIEALFPDPERSFVFAFEGSRLHVQGGCNGLRGAFQVNPDGMLEVTGGMSTMMACPAPLMAADAALTALMAGTLEPVLVAGAQPTLALLTAAGDTLVLTGELTPEARFGAPTRVFLEVAAQTVPCEGSPRGDGQCLQVREVVFDEQGLRVGTPGEWQPLMADIEGYEHQPGIRNVLRLKRFEPPVPAGLPATPIYVLDLVVESEVIGD
jgi:heat shock protein HslJ